MDLSYNSWGFLGEKLKRPVSRSLSIWLFLILLMNESDRFGRFA